MKREKRPRLNIKKILAEFRKLKPWKLTRKQKNAVLYGPGLTKKGTIRKRQAKLPPPE